MKYLLWLILILSLTAISIAQDKASSYFGSDCTGIGLANKVIQIYRANDTTATGLVATDTTDSYGRWDVSLPGSGNYRIRVVAEGLFRDRFSYIKPADDLDRARYYGAKNDGTGDGSTAIQKAIDSSTTTKGDLYFPAGTYRIASSIIYKSGTSIRGAGRDKTVFKFTGTGFAFMDDSTSTTTNNVHLSGFTVNCSTTADGGIRVGSSKAGYSAHDFWLSEIRVINLTKTGSIGLDVKNASHIQVSNSQFLQAEYIGARVRADNLNTGVITFINSQAGGESSPRPKYAYRFENYTPQNIQSIDVLGGYAKGDSACVYIHGTGGNGIARGINLYGLHLEMTTAKGKLINIQGVRGLNVYGCSFYGGGSGIDSVNGIYIARTNTTDNINIFGNTVDQINGTGSAFIHVDSAGAQAINDIIYYGNTNLVTVTTEVKDFKNLLRYGYLRTGSAFPSSGSLREMFYKTLGDTLGIFNGSVWRKIPTQ